MKESVKVLDECKELQIRKGNDYQNPNSRVRQADYYPRGLISLHEIINSKIKRIQSVIEAMEGDPNYKQNFESVEDSLKDTINYCSFAVAYLRGKIDGQDPSRDFLNRKKKEEPPGFGITPRSELLLDKVYCKCDASCGENRRHIYGSDGCIHSVKDSRHA